MIILPNLMVKKGDFVWLYTKAGKYHTHSNDVGTITHNIYWGLDVHVWNNDGDKAYLIHYDNYDNVLSKA